MRAKRVVRKSERERAEGKLREWKLRLFEKCFSCFLLSTMKFILVNNRNYEFFMMNIFFLSLARFMTYHLDVYVIIGLELY